MICSVLCVKPVRWTEMIRKAQISAMLAAIESDINTYLTEIEHNNRVCMLLSQDTVEYSKKLKSLIEMERECQAEMADARAHEAANIAIRSYNRCGGFCDRCGAPMLIGVNTGTEFKLRLCDKCLGLKGFKEV